jgi:adenylylsulfate kinase
MSLSMKAQKGMVIWLLGHSGAGKSTLAQMVAARLERDGYRTVSLDGDVVRAGMNRDLGFSEADRLENIRRISELCKILLEKDLIVICSFITPLQSHRDLLRKTLGDRYLEIYVECPIAICEERDVKGLYRKARNHEIENFTGIGSGFDAPARPDLTVPTALWQPDKCAEAIFQTAITLM